MRSPDSACNPYLTFAVLLAAGLRGVEKDYVLGPQAEDNVWSLTPEERRAMGYRELPGSLGVALEQMENSELVAEALGEHVFDFFLRNKRAEWENYRSHVTPLRAEDLPVAVAAGDSGCTACVTVDVAKPATQRPEAAQRRPARTGRTAGACAIWRSWAGTPTTHVELLWSLSRAPDADAALRTMVRLAEALGAGLGRAQRARC